MSVRIRASECYVMQAARDDYVLTDASGEPWFTWNDVDTLEKYLSYYGCLYETRHVINKIVALLPPLPK